MGTVVDLRTGKALFNTKTREKLQEGLRPYFKGDSTDSDRSQAVNTVEQILCLALVAGARSLGETLANKIVSAFTKPKVTHVPEDNPAV